MSVYVFTGPTLSHAEARAELEAAYLPPVSQGDVYRVLLKRPLAIGIIDGYFERVPAVWHKEILWAMSQGVHVYGSASMGALRAAELAPFGMEGVGRIYESYRDGTLEDDDEVAVVHGPPETGYRALSVALVNIRRTLEEAERACVLSPAARASLLDAAKGLYYPERTYPRLLELAAGRLSAEELRAFREWLPAGEVNQKREDAIAMLRAMRRHLSENPGPKRVQYTFEYTESWEQATRDAGELRVDGDEGEDTILSDMLLDELRLDPDAYAQAHQGAMLRTLAFVAANQQGVNVTPDAVVEAANDFRSSRGLIEQVELKRWMEENDLDGEQFGRLMLEEALLNFVKSSVEGETGAHLPSHLRVVGEYARLMERARVKRRRLEASGMQNPSLAGVGLSEEELLRWYFTERLGRSLPPDLTSYAREAAFADENDFKRALLREYCYAEMLKGREAGVDPQPPAGKVTARRRAGAVGKGGRRPKQTAD